MTRLKMVLLHYMCLCCHFSNVYCCNVGSYCVCIIVFTKALCLGGGFPPTEGGFPEGFPPTDHNIIYIMYFHVFMDQIKLLLLYYYLSDNLCPEQIESFFFSLGKFVSDPKFRTSRTGLALPCFKGDVSEGRLGGLLRAYGGCLVGEHMYI